MLAKMDEYNRRHFILINSLDNTSSIQLLNDIFDDQTDINKKI